MKPVIKKSLVFFLFLFSLNSSSHAILLTEGVCVDVDYPLDSCDAINLCPSLCKLHSQTWTGGFGTSETLCADQQKLGNAVCECRNPL